MNLGGMVKYFAPLWLVVLCFGGCNRELNKPASSVTATPEEVGMSSLKLSYIDSLVVQYREEHKFPGGVFLVARRGQVVYYKSMGHRSLETDEPYRKDDIFRIASMTKVVTAVAIMQLYEKGKLGLDDPVAKYIPAFEEVGVMDRIHPEDSTYSTIPSNRKITIRHLLTHTSGLAYAKPRYGDLFTIYSKLGFNSRIGLSHPSWSTAQIVDRIADLPLAFHPGEQYVYGYSIDVLGRVVEVVSGIDLDTYFRQNIFEPLGMEDTYFYLPKEKHGRLVPLYDYSEGKLIMYQREEPISVGYPKFENAQAYMGGGGLSSTAHDYARFLQSLLNASQGPGTYSPGQVLRGTPPLIGRKTWELMTSDQFEKLNAAGKGRDNRIGLSYALGFALTTRTGIEAKSPGTFEWGGTFSTKFFVDPKEELIFVGMSQATAMYHQEFYSKMTAIIYGSIED